LCIDLEARGAALEKPNMVFQCLDRLTLNTPPIAIAEKLLCVCYCFVRLCYPTSL